MTTESYFEPKKNILRKNPLVSFFLLSYLFFIIALLIISVIISLTTVSNFFMSFLIAFAAWSPNLAAIIMAFIMEGKKEVKRVFSGWLNWKINPWWYVFGFAPILLVFVSVGLYLLLGGTAPSFESGLTGSVLISMLFFNTIQGATGEEFGWRGFALPSLQKRFNPLVSSIILGLAVSGWHGILHLVSPTGVPEWQFWLLMISYSIIVTWAFNKSKGNILIAMALHFSLNFGLELVSTRLVLIPFENLFDIQTATYTILAILLVIFTGVNLSKEKIKEENSN